MLVVEPSRVQASIIKNYLQEQSLTVVGTAANGKDAIEAVRKLRPRAVISAMHLPDMNGVQLGRADSVGNQGERAGLCADHQRSRRGRLGASLSKLNRVQLLPKPFTPAQLAEALNQVTGASTSLTPAKLPSQTPGKVDRSQLRVLIVDDSATARIHVRTVLQGLGFSQFLEVPDGAHAIAMAARESCDLIVTDYNMPLMDGRALVSYLKQNPATAAIPIVMVTTETDPQVLDPVRQLGVVAIVEKAFPPSVVGPLWIRCFDRSGPATASRCGR